MNHDLISAKLQSDLKNNFFKVYLDIAYFAENWKNCNKIIFKRVNSIVRPSFKVFFCCVNKVHAGPVNNTRDPLEKHNFAFSSCIVADALLKKKKKKWNTNASAFQHFQTDT